MQTPQTIAIIGEEKAQAIAAGLADSRYRVLVCSADFEVNEDFVNTLEEAHPAYDVEAVHCSYEATWEADIIILAMPSDSQLTMAQKIKIVACQKVVLTTEDNTAALEAALPHCKIATAFVGVNEKAFRLPAANRIGINCPVKGAAEAVEAAAELVRTVGFFPVVEEPTIA